MPALPKSALNPYYSSRYAPLDEVWQAVRGPLTDNGIAVIQTAVATDPGYLAIETTLLHASGEWIRGTIRAKLVRAGKKGEVSAPDGIQEDAQSVGKTVTYLKRYGLMGMSGIAPTDDDDGNAASGVDLHATPHSDALNEAVKEPRGPSDTAKALHHELNVAKDMTGLVAAWEHVNAAKLDGLIVGTEVADLRSAKDLRKAALGEEGNDV
jgi:hypothetical protein